MRHLSFSTYCMGETEDLVTLMLKENEDASRFIPVRCSATMANMFVLAYMNRNTDKISIFHLLDVLLREIKNRKPVKLDLVYNPAFGRMDTKLVTCIGEKLFFYPINNLFGIFISRWFNIPIVATGISDDLFVSSEILDKKMLSRFSKGEIYAE